MAAFRAVGFRPSRRRLPRDWQDCTTAIVVNTLRKPTLGKRVDRQSYPDGPGFIKYDKHCGGSSPTCVLRRLLLSILTGDFTCLFRHAVFLVSRDIYRSGRCLPASEGNLSRHRCISDPMTVDGCLSCLPAKSDVLGLA